MAREWAAAFRAKVPDFLVDRAREAGGVRKGWVEDSRVARRVGRDLRVEGPSAAAHKAASLGGVRAADLRVVSRKARDPVEAARRVVE